jgi:hypothetical protein
MKKKKRSLTVFLAGELFSLGQLIGNAYLAEAIYEKSHGRFLCVLPQDIDRGATAPRTVRDHQILALAQCDLALFSLEGPGADAATLGAFLLAKFADIPSVVLRSDPREPGDAWSPFSSPYPRTVVIRIDGPGSYRAILRRRHRRADEALRLAAQHSSADAQRACDEIAGAVVRALDRVREIPPVMPRHLREEVYHWLPRVAGVRGEEKALRREFERYLERKVQRDLL